MGTVVSLASKRVKILEAMEVSVIGKREKLAHINDNDAAAMIDAVTAGARMQGWLATVSYLPTECRIDIFMPEAIRPADAAEAEDRMRDMERRTPMLVSMWQPMFERGGYDKIEVSHRWGSRTETQLRDEGLRGELVGRLLTFPPTALPAVGDALDLVESANPLTILRDTRNDLTFVSLTYRDDALLAAFGDDFPTVPDETGAPIPCFAARTISPDAPPEERERAGRLLMAEALDRLKRLALDGKLRFHVSVWQPQST